MPVADLSGNGGKMREFPLLGVIGDARDDIERSRELGAGSGGHVMKTDIRVTSPELHGPERSIVLFQH